MCDAHSDLDFRSNGCFLDKCLQEFPASGQEEAWPSYYQALLDTYQQDSGNECLRKEFCVLGALWICPCHGCKCIKHKMKTGQGHLNSGNKVTIRFTRGLFPVQLRALGWVCWRPPTPACFQSVARRHLFNLSSSGPGNQLYFSTSSNWNFCFSIFLPFSLFFYLEK